MKYRLLFIVALTLVVAIPRANAQTGYTIACVGADVTTALNAALSGGGLVTLSPGVCKISSPAAFPPNKLTRLVGAGPGITILNQTSTSASGITVFNVSLNNFGGGIENLTITADPALSCSSLAGSTGNGIDVDYAGDNWVIRNVLIYGFSNNLRYRDSWNTYNNTIESICYKNTGILLDYPTASEPSGTGTFTSIGVGTKASGATSTVGILINADGGSLWTNVQEGSADNGIVLRSKAVAGGGAMIGGQWFSNVLADTNTGNGWIFDTATNSGSSIGPIFCSMCWGSFNSNVGVWFNGPSGTITSVEFNGGRISQNAFQGMVISSAARSTTLTGGLHVEDNSFPGTGGTALASPGIEVLAGVQRLTISGITSGNSGMGAITQGTSLVIDSGTTDYLTVTGNNFSAYGGSTSVINGATGTHNIVSCNNKGASGASCP